MKIVLTPDWFIGNDILIEAFSFIVLFLFAFLSFKNYRLNKINKKFLYLSLGFGLIGLAQLAAILTKAVLYYDFGGVAPSIGQAIVTSNILSSIDIFYYIGFFFHRFLTLLGLYVIYRLPRKRKSVGDGVLAVYFIILSAFLSESWYYLFHLTAFVLLVLIISNYESIYRKNKYKNTKILMIAFVLLAISQLIYVLSVFDFIFVLANIVELISYLILLILIGGILYNGKKKKPDGHNIRHSRNNSGKGR